MSKETTIPFSQYRREVAELRDPRIPADASYTEGYEGLSAVNIPVGVEVQVSPDTDQVRFRFDYSDGEVAERNPRTLPGSEGIRIFLGQTVPKCLVVEIDGAKSLLSAGAPSIDPRLVWLWGKELPDRQRKILTRNAVVIANILRTMPEGLRKQVVKMLMYPPRQR